MNFTIIFYEFYPKQLALRKNFHVPNKVIIFEAIMTSFVKKNIIVMFVVWNEPLFAYLINISRTGNYT